MARNLLLAGAALGAVALASCDDTTDTLGQTLTNNVDIFKSVADTFEVSTRSVLSDSVLSRSRYSYLGHVKDTETGTYVTSHFTSQFALLEDIYRNEGYFPVADSMASRDQNGNIVAESCRLRVYINSLVGDTLNPMKFTAYELSKPITATANYYTNFDPEAAGFVRMDADRIKRDKSYTAVDLNLSDSIRNLITTESATYYKPITMSLNDEYVHIDTVNGQAVRTTYNNYGSYILQSYYAHPEWFKNSQTFAKHVCPGFYFKSTGGLGVMSQIYMTDLTITYKYYTSATETATATTQLMGTEEVTRTTSIVNDKERLAELAANENCTYLKAPAGIFTEVTLPVEDIMNGHETDTISSAKLAFTAYNSTDEDNLFTAPDEVMILPKDSLYSFFEDGDLPDSKLSYVASYSTAYNTYTFNNIATLVTKMWEAKGSSSDWNKAVLIPITRNYSTTSSSSSSATLVSVSNDMSLKSVKLVKGLHLGKTELTTRPSHKDNGHSPVTISVIYNKFSE